MHKLLYVTFPLVVDVHAIGGNECIADAVALITATLRCAMGILKDIDGMGVQTASNEYVCVSVTFFMPELKLQYSK